jgi:predicted secreted Zn-dependent protease
MSGRNLAYVICIALLHGACQPPPTPKPLGLDKVHDTVSVDTKYYSVTGTTTDAVRRSLEANWVEPEVVGLTEAEIEYEPKVTSYDDYCHLEWIDINMKVVMTIPRHSNPSALNSLLSKRWSKFAQDTAKHEQQHTDIHLEGIENLKAKMAEIPDIHTNCNEAYSALDVIYEEEWELNTLRQREFHSSEAMECSFQEYFFEFQIDQHETEMNAYDKELKNLKQQMEQLEQQITEMDESMLWYESIGDTASYNNLVDPYNNALLLYDARSDHYNDTVSKYNRELNKINDLVDQMYWSC